MEIKKTQQSSTAASSKESGATTHQAKNYLADIKTEFNKISWTNPEELRLYTKMVVGATFLLGMGIYVVDLLIQGVLNTLSHTIQILFG